MVMQKLAAGIDKGVDRLGRSGAWFTLVMVILMALIVILRYLFRFGSVALQESVIYINALIFMIGAAYTLKEQGHVRVDIFYRKLGERQRALIDVLGYALFLLPMTLFIIYGSWDYVAVSWRIREGSAETSGLPFVYLLKSTIPVLAGLLLLQGVAEFWKALGRLRAGQP
jgi:TRAP-type mannitol/chloroaromatic compound transport system permease small subunit